MVERNRTLLMISQLEEVIRPALKDFYRFRSAHSSNCWYLTSRRSGEVYALIFDGEPPSWRATNVLGTDSERDQIELQVRNLCTVTK